MTNQTATPRCACARAWNHSRDCAWYAEGHELVAGVRDEARRQDEAINELAPRERNVEGDGTCPQCGDVGACNGGPCPLIKEGEA